MTHKTKFSIFAAIMLWASAFVGIRAGLQGYSPEGLALFRYLIASGCMFFICCCLSHKPKMPLLDRICLLGVGAIGIGIYNLTLNYGEIAVSSAMASFIISQSPIITAFLALLFLGERLNTLRALGFLVSLAGVVFIALAEKGGFCWNGSVKYIFAATIAGSLYTILQKPYLKKYDSIHVTSHLIWGGTLFLCFYASHLQQDLISASFHTTLIVIYLGIFPAALGYLAWGYALSQINAARAASYFYFIPFVATLMGWVCLGETPAILGLLGGISAIFGVWLVNVSYREKSLCA